MWNTNHSRNKRDQTVKAPPSVWFVVMWLVWSAPKFKFTDFTEFISKRSICSRMVWAPVGLGHIVKVFIMTHRNNRPGSEKEIQYESTPTRCCQLNQVKYLCVKWLNELHQGWKQTISGLEWTNFTPDKRNHTKRKTHDSWIQMDQSVNAPLELVQ